MIAPLSNPIVESPSLAPISREGGQAYELKFLVDEPLAGSIEEWARVHLRPDPHGDPALGGAYRITTLYFDTPELDVYHRCWSYRRRKFRVRRYGSETLVFLERKNKSGDRLSKRRSTIPEQELQQVAMPASLESWPGHWFQQRLQLRRLVPACVVSYVRSAFVAECAEGPLRLTLDRQILGAPADGWKATPVHNGRPLLADHVVLELKFRNVLPWPFKRLMQEFRLNPAAISKYRACQEAWGVTPIGDVMRRGKPPMARHSAVSLMPTANGQVHHA